jgi:NAD+ synthetase
VGGNTELVFDGTSLWADPTGIRHELVSFRETVAIIDERDHPTLPGGPEDVEEAVADALVLGIRDFFRKCGLAIAWIGVSGGIDSALVAALATEALGRDAVRAVAMPGRYSAASSLEDAEALARALGIDLLVIPIESAHAGLAAAIRGGAGDEPAGIADENLQARIRGTILMTLSNSRGGGVLATGNKSEIGVGYCTLYGDLCGALAPLGDVPKLGVYRLARLPRFAKSIPPRTFSRPPTAELRPGQLDSDSLPPYDALDPVLTGWLEDGLGIADLRAAGHDPRVIEAVVSRIEGSEHKRAQTPPIIRVTPKAFGLGRRVPIARGPSER